MDKEVKKTIRRFLWLDDFFTSTGSIWSAFDEIEDELEEMFGSSRKPAEIFQDFLKLKKDKE
ncbi:MAG: hypothetical protein K0R84_2507 [Clostridia bacterium]|nr:hypothetical protein [Clostridia bacterium]